MRGSVVDRLRRRFRPSTPERRDFLKGIVAALSASLGSMQLDCVSAASQDRRVLVVGGGLGGLACADALLRAGCDVRLFEARDRVGGRVISFHDWLPGQTIEGGGELIGENHPAWWSYQRRFGLGLTEIPDLEELEMPILLDGRRIGKAEGEAIFAEIEEVLERLTEWARPIDAEQPWASPNARQFDRQSIADWLSRQKLTLQATKLISIVIESDNGVALSDASLLAMLAVIRGGGLEAYWESSETHRCEDGNQQLATCLAEAIGASRIHLKQPVVAIEQKEQRILVTTRDGARWEGDDVVLAVPPSVWSGIDFDPPLPSSLQPQMGNSLKYLGMVRQRFWEERGWSAEAVTDTFISQTWDSTSCHPERTPEACVVGFSGGRSAVECLAMPQGELHLRYGEAFERCFPGYRNAALKARMMDWPKDPLTRGGYSFPGVGQVTSIGPILRNGIGRLHFCGEHTCYAFVGYMEGALQSGLQLAQRMLRS